MDTAAIQNAAVQTMASGLGVGGIQSAGSDAFAALIQQLLANMMEGMEDGSGLFGGNLAALLGQQMMQEDTQEQGTKNGMEMLADLFFNSGVGMFPQDVEALQQILSQGQQMSVQDGQDIMARWELLTQAVMDGDTQAVQQDQPFDIREALQQVAQQSQGTADEPQVKMEVLSAGQKQSGENLEEGLLDGQGKFSNAVMEAKKLMKNGTAESTDAPVDVESLQRHADAGRLNNVQANQEKLPDIKDIASQVKTGILENTAQGKNEFVIKLKPDGLGEITVKMLETSGRISLSILTNSTQVAKLLSSEILSLKEALRPYEADVREIVTQNENAYASGHDGQFAGQQFADSRRQEQYAWQQQNGYSYYGSDSDEDGSLYDTLGQMLDSELNRYI